MDDNLKKDNSQTEILKLIAPGTPLREGLENILKAKTGALIIIGDSKEVLELVDGGFNINEEYTPARLYELAKMDGAIVLSEDLKRILRANAQIIPSPSIPTKETGTRHRTAERTAKQTGKLVISISQRRNIITVFKENFRYTIEDTSKIITKANQALQILEKYKKVFDDKLNILNEYEFNDIVTLENVVKAIQRAELMMRVVSEVKGYIIELGDEGRLVDMQLKELSENIDHEEMLILKDYSIAKAKIEDVLEDIMNLSHNELMDANLIAKKLGYVVENRLEEVEVATKGYRILSKIPKTPLNIIENMNKSIGDFQQILRATIEDLDDVDGIGEIRAKNIKQGIKRMQEQVFYDSRFYK